MKNYLAKCVNYLAKEMEGMWTYPMGANDVAKDLIG